MPTYFCHSQPGVVSPESRLALAGRITATHTLETGAPASFTQVIFNDIGVSDSHFIGGRPADSATIFLYGNIRQGRSTETKGRLMTGLRDLIVEVTGVSVDAVWVYLTELVPQQMIEFGQVLPAHGDEQTWLDALPPPLRARLQDFDTPQDPPGR